MLILRGTYIFFRKHEGEIVQFEVMIHHVMIRHKNMKVVVSIYWGVLFKKTDRPSNDSP